MIRVQLQALFECFSSTISLMVVIALHEDQPELEVSLRVRLIETDRSAEVVCCLFFVTLVIVGSGEVEVALG